MGKKKSNARILGQDGAPCPRCGRPTEIREHAAIREKELRRPFYYSRWYNCTNAACVTTLIMPAEFMVWNDPVKNEEEKRLRAIREQLEPRG